MDIVLKMEPYLLHVLICLVLVSTAGSRLVSMRKYAAGITRIHNKYRNQEYASNMQMMIWDTSLAQRAAKWSENCYWGHQKRGLGENLAYQWSTGVLKPSDVIIKAIKGWHNEKYIWRWSTNCGAACHYTQMVWAKTTKIGCAYSICNQLRTTGSPINNAHFLVCFYNPPGNYYGQYPFWYGQRCAQCGETDICQKGLCCSKAQARQIQYLPNGKGDEEELTSQEHKQLSNKQKRPIIDRNKISVSIQIRYDGKILQYDEIQQKYRALIINDAIHHLQQNKK